MSESAKVMTDDELDELARQLRQGTGRELRAEAAEDEQLTEIQRRRRRDMADVARDAMHRGDRVTVSVGGLHLVHDIAKVGTDYLVMDAGDGLVDIRLDAAVLTVAPRAHGGRSATPAATTFRSRLAEHEYLALPVEVVTVDGTRIDGRITVTATDHIAVSGDGFVISYVPIAAVAAVFSSFAPPRG